MDKAVDREFRDCAAHRMPVHTEPLGKTCLGRKFVPLTVVTLGNVAPERFGDRTPDRGSSFARFRHRNFTGGLRLILYNVSSCIVLDGFVYMDAVQTRQDWMGLMARAPEGRVGALLGAAQLNAEKVFLRPPEIGAVMVRGRAGGTGAPFNLGEVTVTRCSIRLSCGTVGHGHVQGRRKACAEAAALVDALMQTDAASKIRDRVLTPLATEESARRDTRARKAAATKVEFFTMVRGE